MDIWRGVWDLNPRTFLPTVFKTAAFDLSANSPLKIRDLQANPGHATCTFRRGFANTYDVSLFKSTLLKSKLLDLASTWI